MTLYLYNYLQRHPQEDFFQIIVTFFKIFITLFITHRYWHDSFFKVFFLLCCSICYLLNSLLSPLHPLVALGFHDIKTYWTLPQVNRLTNRLFHAHILQFTIVKKTSFISSFFNFFTSFILNASSSAFSFSSANFPCNFLDCPILVLLLSSVQYV